MARFAAYAVPCVSGAIGFIATVAVILIHDALTAAPLLT